MAFTKDNPGDFIAAEDVSKLKYTNKVFHQLNKYVYLSNVKP